MREQIDLITIVIPSIALTFFMNCQENVTMRCKCTLHSTVCNNWNKEKPQYWELPYECQKHSSTDPGMGCQGNIRRFPTISLLLNCWQTIIFQWDTKLNFPHGLKRKNSSKKKIQRVWGSNAKGAVFQFQPSQIQV